MQDDAVTGEAAGLAMGLCELGSKSASAIEDMVAYAQVLLSLFSKSWWLFLNLQLIF